MQVLILEDEVVIRELIKTVLYSLTDDVEVLEADTTSKGRALWQQHHPQLVLCDWTLADNSTGLELVKFIRETDTDTPVLMITGRGDRQTVVSSRQSGVTEFIIKPFDPVRLGDRLKAYLSAVSAGEPSKLQISLPPLDAWLKDLKARLMPPPTLGRQTTECQRTTQRPGSGQALAHQPCYYRSADSYCQQRHGQSLWQERRQPARCHQQHRRHHGNATGAGINAEPA